MGMTFPAERLRSARLLLGVGQAEISAAAGLDHSVVPAIERGQCPLTIDIAEAVARVTQLPLSFFAVRPQRSRGIPSGSKRLGTCRRGRAVGYINCSRRP
jgi:transcriptional regulator with XRE-family HTH domain